MLINFNFDVNYRDPTNIEELPNIEFNFDLSDVMDGDCVVHHNFDLDTLGFGDAVRCMVHSSLNGEMREYWDDDSGSYYPCGGFEYEKRDNSNRDGSFNFDVWFMLLQDYFEEQDCGLFW